MSLGTVFDRIDADVAAKLAANFDARGLGLSLCDAYYYSLPLNSGLRPVMVSQRLGLSLVKDPQSATVVAAWVRAIVGSAVAGFVASTFIEARYLTFFGS